jgi:hypothetical protein
MTFIRPFALAAGILGAVGCGTSVSATSGEAGDAEAGAPAMGEADAEAGAPEDADSSPGVASSKVPLEHRPVPAQCSQPRAAGATACNAPIDAGCGGSDQSCTAGLDGRCTCLLTASSTTEDERCTYDDCLADSDCGNGVCYCLFIDSSHFSWRNVCLTRGNCTVDSDCGSGGYCSLSDSGWAPAQSFCHTPQDECVNESDCMDVPNTDSCAYDAGKGLWTCQWLCVDG